MKVLHLPFHTYPQVEPELGKAIIVHSDSPEPMSAPFTLEKAVDGTLALRVYGSANMGIPISAINTFDWVYLSQIKPTLLN